MTTLADILAAVHARTGLLARGTGETATLSTDADEPTLATFVREGATLVASELGRTMASTPVTVIAGATSYDLPSTVGLVRRATITYAGATYDLPISGGVGVEAAASPAAPIDRAGIVGGRLVLSGAPAGSTGATVMLYHEATTVLVGEGEGEGIAPGSDAETGAALVDYALMRWYETLGRQGESSAAEGRFTATLARIAGRPNTSHARTGTVPYRPFM